MYSGNYPKDEVNMRIPENYNGTSLFETLNEPNDRTNDDIKGEPSVADRHNDAEEVFAYSDRDEKGKDNSDGFLGGIFNRFLGKDFKLMMPKLEAEELLILGLAIFLFLSKNGDKECAIVLLILIFIN